MPKETFFNLPEIKRNRILDVLLEEFANHKYQDVSVDRIVDQAGISKGSFYQYFDDKTDSYLYLLQLAMDEKISFMSSFPPPNQDADLFEVLRSMIEAGINFQFSNPRLGKLGYRATMDDVPLPEETRSLISQSGSGYFRTMIQSGIEEGAIAPEIDPELGAFILNTIFTNLGVFVLDRYQLDSEQLMEKGAGLFSRSDIKGTIHQTLDMLERAFKNPILEKDIDDPS